jgi:hypothetical protein
MTMKKVKVLSAVLGFAMLMGAAGCSDNGAKETKETASDVVVETSVASVDEGSGSGATDAGSVTVASESEGTVDEFYFYEGEFVFEEHIDPETTVFEHGITIYGMEIELPCTLGELKALGFEPYWHVYKGEIGMDYMVDGEPVFDFQVMFEDEELEVDEEDVPDMPDDMLIVAICVSNEYAGYEFNGVKEGMTEEEMLAILGTPAYVYDTHGMGKIYYYIDAAGTVYEFAYPHYVDQTETPVLKMITFGAAERMNFLC